MYLHVLLFTTKWASPSNRRGGRWDGSEVCKGKGVLSGTSTTAARASIVVRVTDSSGSDTQTLALDVAPVGGFVNDPDLILHYTFDEGSGTRVWDSAPTGNNHATTVAGAQWIANGRFGGAYGPASTSAGMQNFTPANQSDLNLNPRGDAFTNSPVVQSLKRLRHRRPTFSFETTLQRASA